MIKGEIEDFDETEGVDSISPSDVPNPKRKKHSRGKKKKFNPRGKIKDSKSKKKKRYSQTQVKESKINTTMLQIEKNNITGI